MELTNLRDKLLVENERLRLSDIEALYSEGENFHIAENLLRYYLTSLMFKRYEKKEISLELTRSKAQKSINASYKESLLQQSEKLTNIENAKFPEKISISVEWKNSRMWGANPHATVRSNWGFFEQGTGTAGGCGYDKQSSAIATALNSCPSILKILYTKMEEELQKNPTISKSKKVFPYGSGYGILPYFEGGVGTNCYHDIFKFCGYTMEHSGSGKMFDCYIVKRGIK